MQDSIMVYSIMSNTQEATLPQDKIPVTIQEIQEYEISTDQANSYTVLDLSNPKDLAMMKDAGYEIIDLSASMQSSDSYASSDTLSNDFDMSHLVPEIARATLQSVESGSLIPILKEEIKCNIQKKRLQAGKGLLEVEIKESNTDELSHEDGQRRDARRERNKVAAQKCRLKRRERADVLEQETEELLDDNATLKSEIEKLQAEHETLVNMLRTHDICPRTCNTRLSTCSDDTDIPASPNFMTTGTEDLDIQMELEIEESPESPFTMAIIDADHCTNVFIN